MSIQNSASSWAPRNPLLMTPTEFEQFVCAILEKTMRVEGRLADVMHNVPRWSRGETFILDGEMTYIDDDGRRKRALIECKRHNSRLPRSTVETMAHRTQFLYMDKCMIFSTGGFQTGAVSIAKTLNVATVFVTSAGELEWRTRKSPERQRPTLVDHIPEHIPPDPVVGVLLSQEYDGVRGSVISSKWGNPLRDWLGK